MSNGKTDLNNRIGYNTDEQHVGEQGNSSKNDHGPHAGRHGEPDSHIAGQSGPEILGGTASTRILGQSVDEQLHSQLPSKK